MPQTLSVARDHLERAAATLQGEDNQSRQLRYIIERTINLMDDIRAEMTPVPTPPANVLDFSAFRERMAQGK